VGDASLERDARAIINCGYPYLARHLLVNLEPADVKKEATARDLPIAVRIMRATGWVNTRLASALPAGAVCRLGAGRFKARQRNEAMVE
jgi:predicted ATPase with chaperone activity